mmetsp:Transcript_14443/g.30326  ORF Transcript_14443/g.30326 Transcript_14443/m.30326 type:complete len:246 (-) Transcript_14443:35-772(-)
MQQLRGRGSADQQSQQKYLEGRSGASEVLIVIADGHVLGLLQLPLVLCNERRIDLDLRRLGELAHELQVSLIRQATSQPQEGLLKVVVAPRAEIVVLEVALPVELDVLGLHLSVLDVHLVAHKNNGDVFADAHNVPVPVGNVLVRDARGDIKHDDRALALNVVPISQSTKLLLTSCIPDIEGQWPTVGRELEGIHLYTECRDVLLLKLARQVTLHQSGLTDTAVTNKHKLELWTSSTSHGKVSKD